MGCSYDPAPSTIYPSPAELWMEENGFSENKVDYHVVGSHCHECGVLLQGGRYGYKFLALHAPLCPVKPRAMIPEKSEDECKEHPRTIWR